MAEVPLFSHESRPCAAAKSKGCRINDILHVDWYAASFVEIWWFCAGTSHLGKPMGLLKSNRRLRSYQLRAGCEVLWTRHNVLRRCKSLVKRRSLALEQDEGGCPRCLTHIKTDKAMEVFLQVKLGWPRCVHIGYEISYLGSH
jgi:hypothetical protein